MAKTAPAATERPIDARAKQADETFTRATELHRQGRLDEAIAGYVRAVELEPGRAQLYNNLGVALRARGQFAAAVACYRRAIALKPDDHGTHSNLGNALRALGRLDAAEASHRAALALDPDYVEAHYNLGLVLKDKHAIRPALDCLNRVVQLRPDHVDAHWDRALAWLAGGDLARGFAAYEWHWRLKENPPRDFAAPMWDGAALQGRTILLHAEQGLGDTIHFVRYAPLVAERGGQVVLECQAPLTELLAGVAGVARVVARGASLPAFALHAPLLSLPRIFETTLESIPAPVRYLAPAAGTASEAGRRVAASGDGLKVGIVWAGKPSHRNDRNRSAGLEPFIELLGLAGVRFFGLQVGPRAADLGALGVAGLVHDLSPQLDDFAATAAAIDALDLVVSVDTAAAHLAGALGKPVWLVLPYTPDWRWLHGRQDSPWYPSARLFRQDRFGAWQDVFARVAEALEDLVKSAQIRAP